MRVPACARTYAWQRRHETARMALFCYFEKKKDNLPNSNGPLAKAMPSISIASANSKVRAVLESAVPENKKRGPYAQHTSTEGHDWKESFEHGVAASIQYYTKDFPDLKETTVRDWKKAYRVELKKSVREMSTGDFNINELPEKKRGRPLLLGEELDKQEDKH